MSREARMSAEEWEAHRFIVMMGLDAMRIAMTGKSKIHDVETVCAWLRHAAEQAARLSSPSLIVGRAL